MKCDRCREELSDDAMGKPSYVRTKDAPGRYCSKQCARDDVPRACPGHVITEVDAPFVRLEHVIHVCDRVWAAALEGRLTPEVFLLARGPRTREDDEVLLDWLLEQGVDAERVGLSIERDAAERVRDVFANVPPARPMTDMTVHGAASCVVAVHVGREVQRIVVEWKPEPIPATSSTKVHAKSSVHLMGRDASGAEHELMMPKQQDAVVPTSVGELSLFIEARATLPGHVLEEDIEIGFADDDE